MTMDAENYKRPPVDRAHIDSLIARLLELREQSDPSRGEEATHLKDLNASWAIRLAGELSNELVGWAYDYLAGMACEGLSPVPMPPNAADASERYKSARLAVSDHRHEAVGAALRQRPDGSPSPIARQFLGSIMRSAPFGRQWAKDANTFADALDALEVGDVMPLLEPAMKGRKKSYEELRWMLVAIRHVHFRRARGAQAKEAQSEVASAYGVDSETIRTWENRLKEDNPLQMDIAVTSANRDGERYKKQIRAFYEGKSSESDPNFFEMTYGLVALKKDGDAFKRATRERVVRKNQSANQNTES